MIYGYIRVSSDKQTVENQRFEINKFCERNVSTVPVPAVTNHLSPMSQQSLLY